MSEIAAAPVVVTATAAPVKMSLAAELAAALATPPADEAPSVVETEAAVESAVAAPAAEAVAAEEPPVAVAETKKEPTQAEASLARRLSMLAAADKRAKADKEARAKADADQAARDADMKPLLERLQAAKGAKSKKEAARIALGLDDEGVADLFLELNEQFEGGAKVSPKDPAAEIEKIVSRKLDEHLRAQDEERKAETLRQLETGRAGYYSDTMKVLGADGDAYPHVAIAPPARVDITAISEAWLRANGSFPRPEEVLALIESERKENLGKRLKKPEGSTPGTSTAPADAGKGSGKPRASIRSNDVAVVPGAKLTLEQEFALEMKRAAASQ